MKEHASIVVVAFLLGLFSLWSLVRVPNLQAQGEPFYKGKIIRIVVGYNAGGGYDIWARLIAPHLGKQIPGNPEMIVQNMPGAGSIIAANYVYGVARPDGLTLAMVQNNAYLDQLVGHKEVRFDVRNFNWIGAADKAHSVIFIRADTPYKSVEDIVKSKEPPRCGSTGTTASDYVLSQILNETVGAKMNHVLGYPGSGEVALAFERAEVHCMGMAISLFFAREPFVTWNKKGFIRFLVQGGRKRDPRVPTAPTIYELMDEYKTSEVSRRITQAMLLGGEWSRSILAPPGTPPERVKILRDAFDKTLKQPDLLAEAKKRKLDPDPSPGEDLQARAREVLDQPPEVIERLKKLFGQ